MHRALAVALVTPGAGRLGGLGLDQRLKPGADQLGEHLSSQSTRADAAACRQRRSPLCFTARANTRQPPENAQWVKHFPLG